MDLNTPLPGFRPDIKVFKGPNEPDGSPTYNLQDPVKGKFFLFTWSEYIIFERLKPGMTIEQLTANVNETTTLKVDVGQVRDFMLDCFRHGLLNSPKASEQLAQMKDKQKIGLFYWILYNYLFMRIPLFNPDKFLTRTLHYVKFLGSTPAFVLYSFAGVIGIMLLFLRFGEFINSFSFFFNVEGFLDYFFAISTVKIIHEFSHAYTAKRYGIYVPSMGIALIVLWPVLYTDVSDGWKLTSRKQRIYISAAGIIAETIIAGFCTIGWSVTQPGVANNIFFVIASVTWISTLVINLNPAIRFDGYYILSDLWGVDNLQLRTFAVARWKFRSIFLGLNLPCPEPRLSSKQQFLFVAYAVYTCVYRLFLYTAIAIFVYHTFAKALGIFLFFIEIGVFIIWPITWEIKDLNTIKNQLTLNPRVVTTLAAIGIFLAWAIIPLPHTVSFSGVVVPINQQIIYVPEDSLVREVFVERNQDVVPGQLLAKLESPYLKFNINSLNVDNRTVQKQIDLLSDDDTQSSYIPLKKAELATGREKLAAMQESENELSLKAKIPGKLYEWNQNLHVGMAVPKDFILGKIADPKDVEIIFFVPEEELDVVSVGQSIKFVLYPSRDEVYGKISFINSIRPQLLEYPVLASIYKGKVAVNPDPANGKLNIIDAYYTVHARLEVTDTHLFFGKSGVVEVRGPWRSNLMNVIHEIMRILWREGSL